MGALEGKVAAITGASSGIGEATALALAAEGAAVRWPLAARTASTTSSGGSSPMAAGRSRSRPTSPTRVRRTPSSTRTNEELGGLDILVNNAGVMLLGPIAGAPTDQWRRMIEVNLLGLLYCTHAALPIMGAAGCGHVVNVSSTAGRTANLGSGVYNMTKWGVVGFSEALRQEILNANVRSTIIEPGFVDTELQSHNEHPLVVETMEKMMDDIGKVLESDDIARAIVFAVTQPEHVCINEMLIRPTKQSR